MCGKRSKRFLQLSVLVSLLFFCPLHSSLYAEVVLTDQEAPELQTLITESEKDLTELQTELENVKNDYEEQKKSYEEQLSEERKNKLAGWIVAGGSATTSTVLAVVIIILICL